MIDRTKAPVSNGKINFQTPEVKVLTSNSNISIYFVKKENLPIVYTTVICEAGSKKDPVAKNGLASLTSLLIDEGAGEFDALQLSDEFEKLGSIFASSVNHDYNNFTLLSLKDNFESSFYLLSKILTAPHFKQNDFDREKKKLLDRIIQLQDEPSYIASSVFDKIILKNTFYELPEIGLISTINNINLDDVVKFYNDYIFNNSIKLFIVGNINEHHLIEIVNQNLSNIESAHSSNDNFEKPKIKEKTFYLVDKKGSAQSELRIGHIAKTRNSEDYYPTKIMNTILGGQFSSRINLNLREKKGYTYGANSSFGYFKHTGIFEISTAVNIDNTSDSIKEIFFEIEEIQKNINQEEIDFAKSYLIKQFPSKFETYSQVAKNIESIVTHNLSFDEFNTYQSNIKNVETNEVLKAARENILNEYLTIVIVGDKQKVIPQIEKEFNITPTELDKEGNEI